MSSLLDSYYSSAGANGLTYSDRSRNFVTAFDRPSGTSLADALTRQTYLFGSDYRVRSFPKPARIGYEVVMRQSTQSVQQFLRLLNSL